MCGYGYGSGVGTKGRFSRFQTWCPNLKAMSNDEPAFETAPEIPAVQTAPAVIPAVISATTPAPEAAKPLRSQRGKAVNRKQSALVFLFQFNETVRFEFIRKLYFILAAEFLCAWLVSFVFFVPQVKAFAGQNLWIAENAAFWGLVFSYFVYEKRGDEPVNSYLFVAYTAFQAVAVAFSAVAFGLEAQLNHVLMLTVYWFIGISFYTYQSYLKFDVFNPYVFGGIVGLGIAAIVDHGYLGDSWIMFLYGHTLLTTYEKLRRFTPFDVMIAAFDWNLVLLPVVNAYFLVKYYMW
ncbi:hypothetical protein BC830DRAFT_1077968 [Chytriomyces sp. MP71]|nr:hypothetical protein BC830DRAFT_1077968 [Chytriomyces sp. MP71]